MVVSRHYVRETGPGEVARIVVQDAMLSQGEPRDAARIVVKSGKSCPRTK